MGINMEILAIVARGASSLRHVEILSNEQFRIHLSQLEAVDWHNERIHSDGWCTNSAVQLESVPFSQGL